MSGSDIGIRTDLRAGRLSVDPSSSYPYHSSLDTQSTISMDHGTRTTRYLGLSTRFNLVDANVSGQGEATNGRS